MIVYSSFHSDSTGKELFPVGEKNLTCRCMEGDFDQYPQHVVPWHWHDLFEIDYLLEGSAVFSIPGSEFVMKQGEFQFINYGVMHSSHLTEQKHGILLAILFDTSFLSGLYGSYLEEKYILPVMRCRELEIFRFKPDTPRRIAMASEITQVVEDFREEKYGYEFTARERLSRFWLMLLEETKEAREKNSEKMTDGVDRLKLMMEYIQAHYMDKISIEEIAGAANVSSRECTRCFRKCINMAPGEYLTRFRIMEAAKLLGRTDKTVTEISESCGFSSPSYFARVFEESNGSSPRTYRKHYVRENIPQSSQT